ncbi:uncharacterized protein [Littorina saxatilis]|uniref:Uncharacterized protein n=1 Tax=Littorina saxatilis TaxID=31220 RepID=A0AAN9FZA5_9CAEN
MTTTTATIRMLLLLCVSLSQIRLVSMQSTKSAIIPEDGVYIISMVADPQIKTDTILQLNGNDAGFVAYGHEGVTGGLSAALYLKAGTKVSAKLYGGASRLDVSLATKTKSNFVTVRSKGYAWERSHFVHFHHQYNAQGVWKSISPTSHFSVPTSGIYWVMARTNCKKGNHRPQSVMVGDGLFNGYCTDGKAASASGAFYLKAGRKLNIAFNNRVSVTSDTIFSFVRLESNLAAFTAWVAYEAPRETHERISFDGYTPTNYGNLYESDKRMWNIPVAGSYIVAMRGDPNNRPLNIVLYKSGRKHLFTWYNEGGTKSGQAGIFHFKAGEKLVMLDPNGRHMGRETFMSIALLRAA